MFWLYVGAVIAVVLAGVWLYDRRRKYAVDAEGMDRATGSAKARRSAEPGHQHPGPMGGL